MTETPMLTLPPLTNLTILFYIESVPFTRATIEGRTSLGGSESAALGLARSLAKRGHDIHIFAAKLDLADGDPVVYDSVQWHPAEALGETMKLVPPDVFVSLRMTAPFDSLRVDAGWTVLWNQDMLTSVGQVGPALSQVDELVFVSEYHRAQWLSVDVEDAAMQKAKAYLPQAVQDRMKLLPRMLSWVTRNGFDHTLVPQWPEHQPSHVTNDDRHETEPTRNSLKFCHISRPERALDPLLALWPAVRAALPTAELHLCRYDSMYDAGGWGRVCEAYDAKVAVINNQVGGLIWHGNLDKPALYQLLTSCSLMLYPGIDGFAETSCIAAVEAQACGCVLVGSWKGALSETLGEVAGVLIDGDAMTPAYQQAFVDSVVELAGNADLRAQMQAAGRAHVVPAYTFDAIAADWETHLVDRLQTRLRENPIKVFRKLLHFDHHVAAKLLGEALQDNESVYDLLPIAQQLEVEQGLSLCGRVIRQEEQTAEHYAQFAMDTDAEASISGRLSMMARQLANLPTTPTTLLDVACGNGSFALTALRLIPGLHVTLVDYSEGVLARAAEAIARHGFGDQITIHRADLHLRPQLPNSGTYDAVFCGEYLEHTEDPHLVLDWLESQVHLGGHVLMTTPHGPLTEALPVNIPAQRGHTHHFRMRDIVTLLQRKLAFGYSYISMPDSARGNPMGFWLLQWERAADGIPRPAEPCDHWHTIQTTRPQQRLVAGMMVKDAQAWLDSCLASIWPVVDRIVIVDTGSSDRTKEIAGWYSHVTIYDLADTDIVWPDSGFARVRNLVLDLARDNHQADWLFWVDADEHLIGGEFLHRHLHPTSPFDGYVVRQNHRMADFDAFADIPCRIIRADEDGPRFYGLIHEQPETAMNHGVYPSRDLPEANLVHYGYETEGIRRHKLITRNFPMLKRELMQAKELPETDQRKMAWVLLIRDLVHLAGYAGASSDDLTPEAQRFLHQAIVAYDKHGLSDPAHRLHHLAYPSYQLALKWLGLGFTVSWGFAAGRDLQRAVKPITFLARTTKEAEFLTSFKTRRWLDGLTPPTYMTTPTHGHPATVTTRGLPTIDVPATLKPRLVLAARRVDDDLLGDN